MHMAAARLGCKRDMVGTELDNSHPGCTNRPRNTILTVWGVNFGREGDMGSTSCQPSMLTIAYSLMSGSARAWTEMEIKECVG